VFVFVDVNRMYRIGTLPFSPSFFPIPDYYPVLVKLQLNLLFFLPFQLAYVLDWNGNGIA
jgi:hypothetical protein